MAEDHSMLFNFGDIEHPFNDPDNAKITVLPVPYDLTTTYISGTRKGPQAILEATKHMELYDEELLKETYRVGIYTSHPIPVEEEQPEAMLHQVSKSISSGFNKGRLQVLLGGEHSISLAPVQELLKVYPDMSVLQLDAHADLRNSYEGTPYNHACIGRRISERCPLVQAGVRSLSKEEADFKESSRVLTISALDFKSNKSSWDALLNGLTNNVYLTLDLDVLDPAIMPSVGTPEPGGLGWYETLSFLKKLSEKKRIVAFDVVELAPQPATIAPDFLAAKLTYRIMGYIAQSRGWL
jgi:agmatinase